MFLSFVLNDICKRFLPLHPRVSADTVDEPFLGEGKQYQEGQYDDGAAGHDKGPLGPVGSALDEKLPKSLGHQHL